MRVNLPAARFQNLIAPNLEAIDVTMALSRTETRQLAKTRDTLLLQLLSGELPVPESLTEIKEVLA